MTKRMIVIFSGSAPPPELPVAETSAEVRVKAVERKVEPMERIRERENISLRGSDPIGGVKVVG